MAALTVSKSGLLDDTLCRNLSSPCTSPVPSRVFLCSAFLPGTGSVILNQLACAQSKKAPCMHVSAGVKELTGSVTKVEGLRFALVVGRFNEFVTRPLVVGALGAFKTHSVKESDIDVCDQEKLMIIPNLSSLMADNWGCGNVNTITEFAHERNFKYYHDITNGRNFKVLFGLDTLSTTCTPGQATCHSKLMEARPILVQGLQVVEENSTRFNTDEVDAECAITADDSMHNMESDKQEEQADKVLNEHEYGVHVSAFLSLLQRCIKNRDLMEGRRLHILIISGGFEYDSSLGAPLIRMYTLFERLMEAQQIFNKLFKPNVFSWSAIISAHGQSGQTEEVFKLYEQMRASSTEPDGHAFVCVLQACSISADLLQGRTIHGHVIESGWESDVYVGSTIIDMYSNCGCVADAHAVFNRVPSGNIVTWSALIKGYSRLNHSKEALQLFHLMQQQGVNPDEVTFISILKACSDVVFKEAQQIHALIIERGFESNAWVSNALIDFYAGCDNVAAAHVMFNRMPEQDVIAYSAMITGYTQCNDGHQALQLYGKLQKDCVEPDLVIFVCILKACTSIADLDRGQDIHADIVSCGFEDNVVIGSAIVDLYAKCGNLVDARREFLRLPSRNTVTWNALITGYTLQDHNSEVLQLFDQLQEEGMNPDSITFGSVLKAYSSIGASEDSRRVHNHMVQRGLDIDDSIGNALIDLYAKQGSFEDAHAIFDGLPNRDVVAWSSLIGGYIQHGYYQDALQLFEHMQLEGTRPDPVAFGSILRACCSTDELDWGRKLNGQIVCGGWEKDLFLGSVLIDMYAKCGSLEDACTLFCKLEDRSVVSWNAMMAGYIQHDNSQEALRLYKEMQAEGVELNLVTFICSLKACSSIAALEQGRQIHCHLINRGYEIDFIAGSTLINMYAKCGSLENANTLFNRLSQRNMVTWSALIAGYAQHSDYQSALKCFIGMKEEGFKPDDVAFTCLLSACSHNADLVEAGCLHFKSMLDEHHILPKIEHYNSIVDLFGNADQLSQAEDLLETIPFRENTIGWTSLLSSCKKHANIDSGKRCFDQLISMDSENTAGYVLMAGMYAQAGMLEDAKKVEELRTHANGWKKPAKAFVEIDQEVHSFIVGDKVHPRSSDIYAKLATLNSQMKEEGYEPCINVVTDDKSDEDKATALCGHSEKLAIAFGLISTAQGATIRVSKNLKMCADCHIATKIISKLEMREIIITDTYCVHHFQDGECSCNCDYR